MMFVQHNLLAENANRQLKVSTGKNAKITEKLSSGYKINRAADDAAGLSISEKMRRQVRGLHQTVDNISEGIGYVQTAEGALNEVHDMLQRMNELAVKAANGTNTAEDRAYIDSEVQALKDEMDRIFRTTTYNEKKVWEPGEQRLLGYEHKQAMEFTNTSEYIPVTNENCGIVAYGNYNITAEEKDGVVIKWTGYDGKPYQTVPISWDELRQNNFSFDMADYFGDKDPANKLYDAQGNPVFHHQVSFSPMETATLEDMVACIDGRSFSSGAGADMLARFEDNKANPVTKKENKDLPSIPSVSLNYSAAYASNHNTGQDNSTSTNIHDFNNADDKFLEPVNSAGTLVQTLPSGGNLTWIPSNGTSDIAIARESTETWEFSFYMDGIGMVKATSSSIYYEATSKDLSDDDMGQNKWWEWRERSYWVNGVLHKEKYKHLFDRHCDAKGRGTLGSLMATLTGKKGDTYPGLLNSGAGGDADGGGRIEINFSLVAEKPYTYGNGQTSSNVGSFTFHFQVLPTDTEQDVLNRINGALNKNTILDFYTPSGNTTSYGDAYFGSATAARRIIDVPIYGGICGFYVQAGTEGGEHISVQYESLSTLFLGLYDTNTLTTESAGQAIDEIKGALQIVSEQRSDFGAYQNRIEHAENINANVEENTQAAESRIRDADISDLMLEYSINNILMQAGTSMLTQANQSSQSIMSLLQ